MKKTKIDWCYSTINPIVGCKRGCPYCYARKINERFHIVKDFSQPELKPACLAPLTNKTPRSIFADSMSDPEYWSEEQTAAVIDWMNKSSQNSFILLTKSPKTIESIRSREDAQQLFNPKNQKLFLGYSCGSVALVEKVFRELLNGGYDQEGKAIEKHSFRPDFLSIEPIEEDIVTSLAYSNPTKDFDELLNRAKDTLKLVILGAETGNRKGKIECQERWVKNAVFLCDVMRRYEKNSIKESVRVFMKSSLKGIMGKGFRQDRLPWPVGDRPKEKGGEKP